jgi:hypothetical protein
VLEDVAKKERESTKVTIREGFQGGNYTDTPERFVFEYTGISSVVGQRP